MFICLWGAIINHMQEGISPKQESAYQPKIFILLEKHVLSQADGIIKEVMMQRPCLYLVYSGVHVAFLRWHGIQKRYF